MLWRGTAVVLGVQSDGPDERVGPASGETGAEDVLPSWRSMRSLGAKETGLTTERESRHKGRDFEMMLCFAHVGVKVNRNSWKNTPSS